MAGSNVGFAEERISAKARKDIVTSKLNGGLLEDIAREFKCSYSLVVSILSQARKSGTIFSDDALVKSVTKEEVNKILALRFRRKELLPMKSISQATGIPLGAVRAICRKHKSYGNAVKASA